MIAPAVNFEQKIKDSIDKAATPVMDWIVDQVKDGLKRNGHVLTGKLLNSIQIVKKFIQDAVEYEMFMEAYGLYLDQGILPENIPYNGRTGAGGTSAFIEGLMRYFRLRGLSEDNARGAAFATANKARMEGMPLGTRGRGTKWFTNTIESVQRHPWLQPNSTDPNSIHGSLTEDLEKVFYSAFLRYPNLKAA